MGQDIQSIENIRDTNTHTNKDIGERKCLLNCRRRRWRYFKKVTSSLSQQAQVLGFPTTRHTYILLPHTNARTHTDTQLKHSCTRTPCWRTLRIRDVCAFMPWNPEGLETKSPSQWGCARQDIHTSNCRMTGVYLALTTAQNGTKIILNAFQVISVLCSPEIIHLTNFCGTQLAKVRLELGPRRMNNKSNIAAMKCPVLSHGSGQLARMLNASLLAERKQVCLHFPAPFSLFLWRHTFLLLFGFSQK